jgi:hypothetical protein
MYRSSLNLGASIYWNPQGLSRPIMGLFYLYTCTFTVYFLICMKVRDSDILARVWGQRKMSQVMGMFGLWDFTMLRPVLTWCTFRNLRTIYFFNFPTFLGCGKLWITETTDTEPADRMAQLYTHLFIVSLMTMSVTQDSTMWNARLMNNTLDRQCNETSVTSSAILSQLLPRRVMNTVENLREERYLLYCNIQ